MPNAFLIFLISNIFKDDSVKTRFSLYFVIFAKDTETFEQYIIIILIHIQFSYENIFYNKQNYKTNKN